MRTTENAQKCAKGGMKKDNGKRFQKWFQTPEPARRKGLNIVKHFSLPRLQNGATDRIRTYDPLITNEMLYQLSYSSIEQMNYTINNPLCTRG